MLTSDWHCNSYADGRTCKRKIQPMCFITIALSPVIVTHNSNKKLFTTQSDKIYKITRFYAFKCAVSTISKTFFFKNSEFEDKDACKLFLFQKKHFFEIVETAHLNALFYKFCLTGYASIRESFSVAAQMQLRALLLMNNDHLKNDFTCSLNLPTHLLLTISFSNSSHILNFRKKIFCKIIFFNFSIFFFKISKNILFSIFCTIMFF